MFPATVLLGRFLQSDLAVTKSDQMHRAFKSIIEKGGAKFQYSLNCWLLAGRIQQRLWDGEKDTTDHLFGFPWSISVPQLFQSMKHNFELLFNLTHILIRLKGSGKNEFLLGESKTAKTISLFLYLKKKNYLR